MPNKLTDTEIKKALECCSTYHDVSDCKNCPLDGKCEPNMLEQYALDLINRQEEEKQNLKAEIEQLKETIEVLRYVVEQSHIIRKGGKSPLSLIKAEAYKEFADKLEEAFSKTERQMPNSEVVKQTVLICRNAIRLVLNRLVGDNNAGEN